LVEAVRWSARCWGAVRRYSTVYHRWVARVKHRSRRPISPRAVLPLSTPMPIEVRDASVHSCHAALLDLCGAARTDGCVGCMWPGDDQLPMGFGFFHRWFILGHEYARSLAWSVLSEAGAQVCMAAGVRSAMRLTSRQSAPIYWTFAFQFHVP
jgi:hypothetical protein